jgi:hypothetical protein
VARSHEVTLKAAQPQKRSLEGFAKIDKSSGSDVPLLLVLVLFCNKNIIIKPRRARGTPYKSPAKGRLQNSLLNGC